MTFVVLTAFFRLIGLTGIGLIISIPAWFIMAPWSMVDVNNRINEQNRALGFVLTEDVLAARSNANVTDAQP